MLAGGGLGWGVDDIAPSHFEFSPNEPHIKRRRLAGLAILHSIAAQLCLVGAARCRSRLTQLVEVDLLDLGELLG
eukprot:5775813-Pleurochrysis_carterae.AAC.1